MRLIPSFYALWPVFISYVNCLVVPQQILDGAESYVVMFKLGLTDDVREAHTEGLNVDSFSLGNDFYGYHGRFTNDQLTILMNNPAVDVIEKDSVGQFTETTVQHDSTWALSSISHRNLTLKSEFLYDTNGGKGVTVYVIDSGVKTNHEEFEGRAEWITAVTFPHLHIDYLGHGTHVAGIVGSKTFGVAKNVRIKVVGVAEGINVSLSAVVKGLEVAVKDHLKSRDQKGFKGSVINLSVAFPASQVLDRALEAAVAHGIHIAAGAGNNNDDSCKLSPARSKSVLTVGAVDSKHIKADFSNWGPCVDIFAPGYNVESTFITTKTAFMAGTSMASPHVAGLLAYYLSLYPENESEFAADLTPAVLRERILKYSTKNVIQDLGATTPNKLAYNGGGKPVW